MLYEVITITGGEVRANRRGEKGLQPVTLTPEGQKDPLFAGFANRFTAFQWHNVITSYSIHYTKLYEGLGRLKPRP